MLRKLQEVGLQINIRKYEFKVKLTKYLEFIIKAGKGIYIDLVKVAAIHGWEAPRTIRGVRAFLGFANFY